GRVATLGSIQVLRPGEIMTLPSVFHRVSMVTARLRERLGPFDAVAALYPAASISGAPKIRAMELIEELEPEARGAYCGALFALQAGDEGLRGSFSVAIRTATAVGRARSWDLKWRAGG